MKKRALLFGNVNYAQPFTKVTSATNDVKALQYKLNQLQFDVSEYHNCSKNEIWERTKAFIDEAPCDCTNIIYFSGHGFQLNGINYIAPTDFGSNYLITGIGESACSLDEMMLYTKTKESNFIFIIDACRDNILKGVNQNYADMKIYPNVYIAFATQFNETASYVPNGFSFFTKALCDNILTPNISIDELFRQIRNDLYKSYGSQLSNAVDGLLKKVTLNPINQTENLDYEIYNFVEEFGEKYNEKFGYFAGEIELFIDTSQRYNVSLLEVMYRYEKISSEMCKLQPLEEDESKWVTFKYLISMGLKESNYSWSYRGRKVRIGEIPPLPYTMQKLTPIAGKEIDVSIGFKVQDNGILVKTNLPNGFILQATVDDLIFSGSETVIDKNCYFKFNKENPNKGEYKISLSSPVVNVMTEVNKDVVGIRGRNLCGSCVSFDEIWGNTIEFKGTFTIS